MGGPVRGCLVLNAGSSSLKFGLFALETFCPLASGSIDWAHGDRQRAVMTIETEKGDCPPLPERQGGSLAQMGTVPFSHGVTTRTMVAVPDDRAAATCAIRAVLELRFGDPPSPAVITAVGHRVVHGGTDLPSSVVVDASVKEAIAGLCDLAPLHNPPALEAILAAESALPQAVQVAVFDTAFFAGLPPRAYVCSLPYAWHEQWGIRRFGFHGISHEYCTHRAAEMLDRPLAQLRIVSCHLGGGCSAAAIRGGLPIATTMGFSPLDGLMMGTRPGSVDPGILLHLQRRHGLTVEQLDDALNCRSGLLGVSGVSPDMAKIEVAAQEGNPRARLALEMFTARVRSAIGAMAVTLGGVDVLIFTDRVGEGSAIVRGMVCEGLECLGVRLDPQRNAACHPDCDVAATDSTARILVIHTREELMIAREACRTAARPRVEGQENGNHSF